MMGTAERDGELVADLAAHGVGLGEADMVRIRRCGAAEQARLGSDVAQVLLVAHAVGLWEGEDTLLDVPAKRRLVDGGRRLTVAESGRAVADFAAGGGEAGGWGSTIVVEVLHRSEACLPSLFGAPSERRRGSGLGGASVWSSEEIPARSLTRCRPKSGGDLPLATQAEEAERPIPLAKSGKAAGRGVMVSEFTVSDSAPVLPPVKPSPIQIPCSCRAPNEANVVSQPLSVSVTCWPPCRYVPVALSYRLNSVAFGSRAKVLPERVLGWNSISKICAKALDWPKLLLLSTNGSRKNG